MRTPALRIGTHFLLTLETIVFLFHLLSATSKPFSSLSTRLAHAARLGFFYQNALYKFTVIIIVLHWICIQGVASPVFEVYALASVLPVIFVVIVIIIINV